MSPRTLVALSLFFALGIVAGSATAQDRVTRTFDGARVTHGSFTRETDGGWAWEPCGESRRADGGRQDEGCSRCEIGARNAANIVACESEWKVERGF